MQAVASFWQLVGWIAGALIVALAIALVTWRRRRAAQVYPGNPSRATPPPPPRKPNGEDQRA